LRIRAFIASAWAEPAARRFAGSAGYRLFDPAHHGALLFDRVLSHADIVGHAVAQPLPPALGAFLHNRGIVDAHIRVQQNGCAYPIPVQDVHDAEHSDTRTVVPQRIAGYVRQVRAWRAGNRFVDVKTFDIRRH
jgi:hypothetical protein